MTVYAFPAIAAHHHLPVGAGVHRLRHAGAGDRRRETGVVTIGATNIGTGHRATDRALIGTDFKPYDRAAKAALSLVNASPISLRTISVPR
jgi:hypothetical protein